MGHRKKAIVIVLLTGAIFFLQCSRNYENTAVDESLVTGKKSIGKEKNKSLIEEGEKIFAMTPLEMKIFGVEFCT